MVEILLIYLEKCFHFIMNYGVPFVVLLGVLIFVHELGHFLVARWCGVRVEVFSLGFGKKVFQYKKGDTNYCVSIVPLGGYVKMFGDQPDAEVSEEDKKFSFTHKNVWQRIAVVLAGPMMNFLFAVVLYALIAVLGEDARLPRLTDIASGSPASEAGFQSGDLILEASQAPIATYEEFQRQLDGHIGETIDIKVQREQSKEAVTLKSKVGEKENPNMFSLKEKIGDIGGISTYARGTTVGVKPKSPLAAFDVKTGDTIIGIGKGKDAIQKVTFWRELERALASTPVNDPITFEIAREKEKQTEKFKVTINGSSLFSKYTSENLGIENSDLYLERIGEGTPAEEAGLKVGDRIKSINGIVMGSWEDVQGRIKNFDGKSTLELNVDRGGEDLKIAIIPKMSKAVGSLGQEEQRYIIGISPIVNYAVPEFIQIKTLNPLRALSRGLGKTIDFSVMTVMSFVRLIQNKVSAKNIGGIISIGQAASETFKLGLGAFLQMMALISVNLFVLNLLPIPVLDGGHLVFYTIEVIRGGPISLRKMELAQQVGMVLLMFLMVFALFNDITRVFKL